MPAIEDLVLKTAASGVPRDKHFPFNPLSGGYERSLLLEGQRTNLLKYSSDLSNVAWTKAGLIVTPAATIAPDGTMTGVKVQDNSAVGRTETNQVVIIPDDTTKYTGSVYLKADTTRCVALFIYNNNGSTIYSLILFDPVTGQTLNMGLPSPDVKVSPEPNGWWRLSMGWTNPGGGSTQLVFSVIPAWANTMQTPEDVSSLNSVYMWGPQFEAGPFPTTYVPTAASSVTRAPDRLSYPFTAPPQEMTVYIKGIALGLGAGNPRLFCIGSAAGPNMSAFGGGAAGYSVIVYDGTNYFITVAVPIVPLGCQLEVAVRLLSDFRVGISQSINGGAIFDIQSTVSLPFLAWGAPIIYIGSDAGLGYEDHFAFQSVQVARGLRNMQWFRNRL